MIKPSRSHVLIVVAIGVFGVSLSAIWIRLAVDTVGSNNRVGFSLFLAALRMIVAAIVLLPTWKNFEFEQTKSSSCYYAIAAGICLAVHFATWIASLSYTSITASTVLVTTNPIWVGLFSWWWYREKPTPIGILGIGMALLGGIIMALADGSSVGNYSNPILGNGLALFGAVMSSLYIIFGSQAQKGLNTSSYIAIAYSMAALCLFPLPFFVGTSYAGYSPEIYLYIFLMALTSQLIGHSSLNWAVRWMSPTFISLSLLFEPAIASSLGAIIFNEVPSINVLLGGSIILCGIAVFLRTNRS